MKTIGIQTTFIMAALAGFGFASPAKADCGFSRLPRLNAGSYQKAKAARAVLPFLKTASKSAASPKDTTATATPSIVGLWHVTFVSDGQVEDEGFDQWSGDGTEILNDNPPPSTGAVCLGVWSKTDSTIKLMHPSWTFDPDGNLTGTAIIKEQIALADDGMSYKGTYTIDVYDLSGAGILHIDGDVSADRITVDN